MEKTACRVLSDLLRLLHGGPNTCASDVMVAGSRITNIEAESAAHKWLDCKLEVFGVIVRAAPDNRRRLPRSIMPIVLIDENVYTRISVSFD